MKQKERIQFIVNPFSGTGQKKKLPELIQTHLDHNRFEYTYTLTERAQHGVTLAKEAVEAGFDIVCAVGGDGSVNEVASSLVGTQTALAVIPAGSGNGFAGHLSLSRNPVEAIQTLNKSQAKLIDTCSANEHFFLNVAGIGFDALVAYKTKKNKRRGLSPYIMTAIKESAAFQPMHLSFEVDGKHIEGNYVAAVVANAMYYGYGFSISPLSSISDGIMDLILIKETQKWRYFMESYRFLTKTLHESKFVDTYRGRDIRIKIDKEEHFHVDGEGYPLDKDLHCKIHPKSLKVMRYP